MLSKKIKYGLKALTLITRRIDCLPVQIETISRSGNISHFLESILLALLKNEFLGSKKDKWGVYYF